VAAVIHLDTHAVVWLYAGETSLFPVGARKRLEREELRISPMVGLELQYLHEVGRISEGASAVLEDLARRLGLAEDDADFASVARAARGLAWTRDPFDRLIVGHAALGGTSLLTKDRTIRRHYRHAVWG
jgi:PIN domain nuclease of toxin-antitoxin system